MSANEISAMLYPPKAHAPSRTGRLASWFVAAQAIVIPYEEDREEGA